MAGPGAQADGGSPVTAHRFLRGSQGRRLPSLDQNLDEVLAARANQATSPLLLVALGCHTGRLRRILAMQGFAVTVADPVEAVTVFAATTFEHAVVEAGLDQESLQLVRQLHALRPRARIVILTDADSFASAIIFLRAGAADYLVTPEDEGELVDALLGRRPVLPPIPITPLDLKRTCWEYLIRRFEQCDRNISETARRLGMHRRSMQRILSKRAPYRHRS